MAFDVKADGTLGKGRVFFDATNWVSPERKGLPDGMKVDAQGQPLRDRSRRRPHLRPRRQAPRHARHRRGHRATALGRRRLDPLHHRRHVHPASSAQGEGRHLLASRRPQGACAPRTAPISTSFGRRTWWIRRAGSGTRCARIGPGMVLAALHRGLGRADRHDHAGRAGRLRRALADPRQLLRSSRSCRRSWDATRSPPARPAWRASTASPARGCGASWLVWSWAAMVS